jgi:hypothetical protein
VAGQSITAGLGATASNVPTGTYDCTVNGPSWSWSYTVQYAATADAWGPPPTNAVYSVSIDAPPANNPSNTTLRATFITPGYWKVTGLTATVTYTSSCGDLWTASGIANDVIVTAISVALSPANVYVAAGNYGPASATVLPPDAGSAVSFSTADSTIASVAGSAPTVTVVGVAPGSTTLQAAVGTQVAATANISVYGITYSPTSGPVFTEVVFSISPAGTGFFSSNTSVTIEGTFTPDGCSPETFSVTHQGQKVRFDPSNPDQLAIAVADVFPSSFLTSSNPGIAMCLTGTITASVTLTDSGKSCCLSVTFTVTSSGLIGPLVNGQVQDSSLLSVWTVTSASDLNGVDPSVFLYAQITRPADDFTANPPTTMSARLQSFYGTGAPVSSGVTATFVLVSSGPSGYVYQSQAPLLLIDNPAYEGTQGNLLAIAGDEACTLQIIRLPQ